MPLTIGGGIETVEQASKIDQGVEKISLNSVVNQNPQIIEKIANKFGSQSVVISVDVKKIEILKFLKMEIIFLNLN